ncbi:uncharacterized protein JCM6883_004340 [Sporobolomyces salmoneus]|uniref:uncharacterized protein n=1 Tax=Sporobolomyces salmoneus TaxID=183962 RepID=UPI003174EB07
MTSLDPSHIPGFERTSDPTTGQAVKTSVSSPKNSDPTSSSSANAQSGQPSWKGAWKRRQEAKLAKRLQDLEEEGSDAEGEEAGGDGKIPIPPIPDLRYEQGILSSIKPFLHSTKTTTMGKKVKRETEEHEEKLETVEKVVLASSQLTAGTEEDAEGTHQSDALMGPLRIEWGMVSYVLFRDQVIFPLLQGVLWGMAGIYLNGLWEWNRKRLATKDLAQGIRRTQGSSGPGLLSRLGLGV